MQFLTTDFDHLYKKVYDVFKRKYCGGEDPPKARKKYSRDLWDARYEDGEHKGEYIAVVVLLDGESKVYKRGFLYRKWSEANNKETVDIDDSVIVNIFKLLDIPRQDIRTDKEGFRTTWERFLEKYPRQEDEHQKPNENGNTVKIPHGNTPRGGEFSVIEAGVSDAVRRLIKEFFDNIVHRNYEQAWNLLTENFKKDKQWKGVYKTFAKRFSSTTFIRQISLFNFDTAIEHMVKFKLFYIEQIKTPFSTELSALRYLTVDEIDKVTEYIEKIKSKVVMAGGEDFGDIKLVRLFEESPYEHIWYKCNIGTENLSVAFDKTSSETIERLYNCTCTFWNGRWFIDAIDVA